jgi:hypothetical protein
MKVATRTAFLLALAVAAGCRPAGTAQPHAGPHDEPAQAATAAAGKDHSHWWCAEHGVPEEICSRCDSQMAAEFQRKGDWCAEHDRAKSQCFACDPAERERFAAQYRAKYGEDPPPTEDDETPPAGQEI